MYHVHYTKLIFLQGIKGASIFPYHFPYPAVIAKIISGVPDKMSGRHSMFCRTFWVPIRHFLTWWLANIWALMSGIFRDHCIRTISDFDGLVGLPLFFLFILQIEGWVGQQQSEHYSDLENGTEKWTLPNDNLVPCSGIYKHWEQRLRTLVVTQCVDQFQHVTKKCGKWPWLRLKIAC